MRAVSEVRVTVRATSQMITIFLNCYSNLIFREITFENAEELTEEGLPFLILFHAENDTDTIKTYKSIVESHLITEKR